MRKLAALSYSLMLSLLAPAVMAQAAAPSVPAAATATPSPSMPAATPSTTTPLVTPTQALVTQDDRVGTFKAVEGETWLGKAADKRAPTAGAALRVADRITTGKSGAATVTLKDGTVLTVGPNSQMDLSQFQFDSTTQKGNLLVELLQGSIRVVTGILAKINPDLFKVSTPTSVVGVRGTDFIVEARASD